MKIYLILCIFLFLQFRIIGQEVALTSDSIQVIQVPEFYEGEGVIFPANSVDCPCYDSIRERYTPSIEDIIKVEGIIISEIENQFKNACDTVIEFKSRLRTKYNRQYFGYIETDGSKVIVIHFMNFQETPNLYRGWKERLVHGTGDGYGTASRFQWINITSRTRYYDTPLDWN